PHTNPNHTSTQASSLQARRHGRGRWQFRLQPSISRRYGCAPNRTSMRVEALGYVQARTRDLADWASFGPGLLGLQRVDKSRSTLAFRMDDRKQRIIVNAD